MNPDTGEIAVLREQLAETTRKLSGELEEAKQIEKLQEKLLQVGETAREFNSAQEMKAAGFTVPLTASQAQHMAGLPKTVRKELARLRKKEASVSKRKRKRKAKERRALARKRRKAA